MATPDFYYQDRFPLGDDQTEYYLLTKEFVSLAKFEGEEIVKVDPEGLAVLAKAAMHDTSFMLRT
ncbi:MAG TPA: fumarate hydratase, partial [Tenuifilaceae bacterium]|nr:fumarate hydratase [Tenuifilaceae bacterium]